MNQLLLDLQPSPSEYRTIPLSRGQTALVDTEDYERLNRWSWFADWNPLLKGFYAKRTIKIDGKKHSVYMHREIMRAPKGIEVDHRVPHTTLDNRKQNLRLCTHAENGRNQGIPSHNTSGFKGVHLDRSRGKWVAQIKIHRKNKHLGRFATAEEAYSAYVEAGRELHGEFANSGSQS